MERADLEMVGTAEPAGAGRAARLVWGLVVGVVALGLVAVVATRRPPAEPNPRPDPDVPGPAVVTPLLLGSASSQLGQDPELPTEAQVWLNVAGRGASTANGDLYTAGGCIDPVT